MPNQRKNTKREDTQRPIYDLRSAVTELIHWFQEWEMPDPEVMIQALWLINLDGVPNSGVRGTTAKTLRLMREVSHDRIGPQEAFTTMKEWEVHG